jgi:hypothetical protein
MSEILGLALVVLALVTPLFLWLCLVESWRSMSKKVPLSNAGSVFS